MQLPISIQQSQQFANSNKNNKINNNKGRNKKKGHRMVKIIKNNNLLILNAWL